MSPDSTIYTKSYTAAADTPFQIDDDPTVLLTAINIHCYTNDSYYGNTAFQNSIIRANAVVWLDGIIRVSDLWFKNLTAGSNATIVLTGLLKKG